jgi:hypothetical protein
VRRSADCDEQQANREVASHVCIMSWVAGVSCVRTWPVTALVDVDFCHTDSAQKCG